MYVTTLICDVVIGTMEKLSNQMKWKEHQVQTKMYFLHLESVIRHKFSALLFLIFNAGSIGILSLGFPFEDNMLLQLESMHKQTI
jgi:hypothetical protein